MQQFQVKPSEPDKEAPYIATQHRGHPRRRTTSTTSRCTQYDANADADAGRSSSADAESLPGIRLVDPRWSSDAFEQLQQVRGYYSVAPVLDVDRYKIDGTRPRRGARGPRARPERPARRPANWSNVHTVYTHGYGVIAAYGNQRDATTSRSDSDGKPVWAEQDLPPEGDLTDMLAERLPAADLLRREQPRLLHRRQGARRRRTSSSTCPRGSGVDDATHEHLRRQGRRRRSAACSTSCSTP